MRIQAHAIEDENVEALKAGDRFVGDKIQIGCVGEIIEAIRDHGQLAVDDLERRDLDIADAKRRMVVNRMRDELRQAAAEVRWFENVLKDAAKIDPRDLVREDRHRTVSKIQRPNIVEAEYVVDVAMRDQHGIDFSNVSS